MNRVILNLFQNLFQINRQALKRVQGDGYSRAPSFLKLLFSYYFLFLHW